MQRAWATGAEHDRGPLEWVASIGNDSTVAGHIRLAFDAAVAPDATLAQCLTGMLAVECVTYLQGGDADIDEIIHVWMRDIHPNSDEALRLSALEVLAKLRTESALATHWHGEPTERRAEWVTSLDNLRDRLTTAKRKPDPRQDPRIIAFGKSFKTAKDHLRVALVPYEITDEPSVNVLLAPGLSIVVHYADVGDLEPVPVPLEHARAWNRTAKDLAKLAAKRTRDVTDVRTHILEHDGFEVALAFGSNPFTAGLLPYANLLLADGGAPHGMLVAAPNAGTVVYHRIVDAKWSEAAVEVIGQAREIHANGAQPISPLLWWWHKSKVIELPYTLIADNVIVQSVDAFVNQVKKLGG